jgi:hypothetical protein
MSEAAASLPPDTYLVAADGSRHPAHRLVLSARSPFFLKMFSTNMRESRSGEVQLPDVEPERLATMLAWMYGGQARVCLDSAAEALSLLELAKRWEVVELCEQLGSCEACALTESNVLEIWETAQRLCLERLESRCRDFVMAQLAATLQRNGSLPPALRELRPAQFQRLLESDDLPVSNEEEAFDLALAYIRDQEESLSPEECEDLLLAVRWRLVPGPFIAERAMLHPALHDKDTGTLRPRLLPVLADGMQFQFLGGKASHLLPKCPAGILRARHRIPVRSYASLATGMKVRVISDVEQLRHLSKRCAPGAKLKVEWVAEMKSLVGASCTVKELRDEICGVQIEDPIAHVDRYLPFDALLLA